MTKWESAPSAASPGEGRGGGRPLFVLLFAAAAAASPVAAVAAAAPVAARSTAAYAADGAGIEAMKALIEADQRQVLKARAAVKQAGSGESRPAVKAREEWRAAKEKLKADRKALRQAIEDRERERAAAQRARTGPVKARRSGP